MGVRKWAVGKDLPIEDGDKVIVWWTRGYGNNSVSYVETVARKTKTQLVTDAGRFYHDGKEVVARDSYSRIYKYIEPWTQERLDGFLQEAAEARRLNDLESRLSRIKARKLTEEQRERLLSLLVSFDPVKSDAD